MPLPNWPTSASQIAADAQRVANANQPNPAYEWLFKPSDSTEMAVSEALKLMPGALR